MKDTSKANWPEGMGQNGVNEYDNPKEFELFIGDERRAVVAVFGDTMELVQSRSKQIQHLPQMVALLKEMSELDDLDRINLGSLKVSIDAILRSIGEVE